MFAGDGMAGKFPKFGESLMGGITKRFPTPQGYPPLPPASLSPPPALSSSPLFRVPSTPTSYNLYYVNQSTLLYLIISYTYKVEGFERGIQSTNTLNFSFLSFYSLHYQNLSKSRRNTAKSWKSRKMMKGRSYEISKNIELSNT